MAAGSPQLLRTDLAHSDLGASRTYLALERTLMAWTRTAASLISFGFSIYKFFETFGQRADGSHQLGYRPFAAIMIGVGLVSLAMATIQHLRETHRLEEEYHIKRRYMAPAMSALIAGLGIFGMIIVALRK